jgi:Asp-tRNA(Asn)/Glu-tRNA(Gln) amidotransferase C subunit
MHPTEPSDHERAIHRLKEEIERLTKQQAQALESATYLVMSPDEAKQYDARRAQILKLVEQLRQLEKDI